LQPNKKRGKYKMKIVGVRLETGVYNEKPWKKYVLTCEHDRKEGEFALGSNCYVFNIKGTDFENLLKGFGIDVVDMSDLLGRNITGIYYNKYQKISGFTLADGE
jgi:hypothetical protein